MIVSKMFGVNKYFFKNLEAGKLEFVFNIDLAHKFPESDEGMTQATEIAKEIEGELEDRDPMYLIDLLQLNRNIVVNHNEAFGIFEFLLMHDTDFFVDQVDESTHRCRIALEISADEATANFI